MHKLKIFIPLLISAFILCSCSKQSEDELFNAGKAKIEEGKKFDADNKPDDAKKSYGEAIDLLKKLIQDYPNSPKVPDSYNEIAKLYVDNFKDYPNAIKYYKELSDKYPNAKEAKYAMFMIAFIYDEMLKDKQMAIESYKKFLDKYPTDENPNEKMSESAKMMLQMLQDNRSIEDIIKNNTSNPKDSVKTKKDSVTAPVDKKKNQKDKADDRRVPPQKTDKPQNQ